MLKVNDGRTLKGDILEQWYLIEEKVSMIILYDKKGMLKSYEFMGGI